MGSEKFCLRWNDFETNISAAFKDLRDDKDFFDVTLSCDDEQIQAHKVILSACSPFFRNVLRRNPHPHPLLYLKSVKYTDIQAVLNFMYHGEVNVAQEELNSFLAVAEDLRVKGLTQSNKQPEPQQSRGHGIKSTSTVIPPTHRKDTIEEPKRGGGSKLVGTGTQSNKTGPIVTADDDVVEYVPVKSEPKDAPTQQQQQQAVVQTPYNPLPSYPAVSTQDMVFQEQENYDDFSQYPEAGYVGDTGSNDWEGNKVAISGMDALNEFINSNILELSPETHMLKCGMCEYTYNRRNNVARHIEAKHVEMQFQCDLCDKITPTRHALYYHKKKHTEFQI